MIKLRNKRGFTLAEMMIAILILTMVTGVAAGGIPAAINAYTEVVDTANAQVLLSTTMTKLREELGTAAEIKLPGTDEGTVEYKNGKPVSAVFSGGLVRYESENGSESRIYTTDSGIMIREYADIVTAASDKTYEHLLVSKSAANKNLYVTYESMEMNYSTGVFSVKNIRVWNDSGSMLADLVCDENPEGAMRIRVLTYIY